MWHILRFLKPPVFEGDEAKTYTARLLNRVLVVIAAMLLFSSLVALPFFYKEKLGSAIIVLTLTLIVAVSHVLMHRGRVSTACAVLVFGVWVTYAVLVLTSGGMGSPNVIFFLAITVLAGLLMGRRIAVLVASISIVAGFGMILVELLGYSLPRIFPAPPIAGWMDLIFGLVLATTTLNLALSTREEALAMARRQLEERQRTELALRQSEETYRVLIETTATGFAVIDHEGRVRDANAEYVRLTGHKELSEILGRRVTEWTAGHDIARNADQVRRCFAEGSVRNLEVDYVDAEGRITPIEINGTILQTAEGPRIVTLCRDISARRRAEGQLRQAQKMESIGRLAGGVAHDFNNLLTVISGYAEMLLAEQSSLPDTVEKLNGIREAGRRAADLTRQLLAFSRKQILQPKLLDLNRTVADTARLLTRLIGEDIQLATVLTTEAATIMADPGQLSQVIMNLAVNARDAMPSGGTLKLETAVASMDEEQLVDAPDAKPGRYVMLSVSDTGCGMTPETQSRVFEPFFTTKEAGKGTGLGLATVYGIVNQSGGFLRVQSEPGRGSTFRVYLPHVGPVAPPSPAEPIGVPKGVETVLVVEDEPEVRRLMHEALADQGFKVLEAESARQAIQLAEQHEGTIHLLIADVVLPKTNGRILAECLTFYRPALKVLYVSGYAADAIVHHGVLDAGTELLQKPFTPLDLILRVRQILDTPRQKS